MKRLLTAFLFCLAACSDLGPELVVNNLAIIAAAPGRQATVAYFELQNHGDKSQLLRVSSPQFDSVEMHETTLTDGIARMRAVDSLTLEAGSTAVFEAGGYHLMLSEPTQPQLPGTMIELRFHFRPDAMLIVQAPVQTRMGEK